MKEQSILKLAEKNGYNVAYKRYEYGDNVLHLNNTAICFNELIMNNGFTITAETENFPAFVTKEYIKECVENNYGCLGIINRRNEHKFSGKINYTYKEWLNGCA